MRKLRSIALRQRVRGSSLCRGATLSIIFVNSSVDVQHVNTEGSFKQREVVRMHVYPVKRILRLELRAIFC